MNDELEIKKQEPREIEAGPVEKELRKAFEQTTIRNVLMIQDYSKETRKLVRQLQQNVETLAREVMTYKQLMEQKDQRIAQLLQVIANKGTERDDNG